MQNALPPVIVQVESAIVPIAKKFLRRCLLESLPELERLAAQQEYVQLAQETHNIKGTAGLMGLSELTALSQQLEAAAKGGDALHVEQQLQAMSRFLHSVSIVAG